VPLKDERLKHTNVSPSASQNQVSVKSQVSDFQILGKRFMEESIQNVLIEASDDQQHFTKYSKKYSIYGDFQSTKRLSQQ
jgi:hypothetical protein